MFNVSEQNTPEESREKQRRRKTGKAPEQEIDGGSAKENLGYENEPALGQQVSGNVYNKNLTLRFSSVMFSQTSNFIIFKSNLI